MPMLKINNKIVNEYIIYLHGVGRVRTIRVKAGNINIKGISIERNL